MQRAVVTAALVEAVRQGGSATGHAFRNLVDSSPEMVMVTDATLDRPGPYIRYVNPAFSVVTGWAAEKVLGGSPRLLQGAGTDPATMAAIGTALRAGCEARARILNYTRNGVPFWSDMQIIPLLDRRGRVGVFAGFARAVGAPLPALDAGHNMAPFGEDDPAEAAEQDPLTGLPGWEALRRVAGAELAAQRGGRFCLACLGLDDLAELRARLGLQAADSVLIGVAGLLARNLRRVDLVGRIGESSFAVCMPGLAMSEARGVAGRLRAAVAAATFPTPAGPAGVSCGTGIAAALPTDRFEDVVARARASLYEAGQLSGNRLVRV